MVQLMLEALQQPARASRLTIYHIDARYSEDLGDIGGWKAGKFFKLGRYLFTALRLRITKGPLWLYYVPAPPKKSAIIRDLCALAVLRVCFPKLILHWHAVGLGAWSKSHLLPGRLLQHLLQGAELAILPLEANATDARVFQPKKVVVIPNGIPDPCPELSDLLAIKETRQKLVHSWIQGSHSLPPQAAINLLFLAHCTRSKGIFEVLNGLLSACKQRADLRWHLTIAGSFVSPEEEATIRHLAAGLPRDQATVDFAGFVTGPVKAALLKTCDLLLFPSHTESFGLVAVEALAYATPVLASDIPALRQLLDGTGCTLTEVKNSESVATGLLKASSFAEPRGLRNSFESNYTLHAFQTRITKALIAPG